MVPKSFPHNKIINKAQTTKNQENFAHHFGEIYLTNHLPKSVQDRIEPYRVGTCRVSTGYEFFLIKKR